MRLLLPFAALLALCLAYRMSRSTERGPEPRPVEVAEARLEVGEELAGVVGTLPKVPLEEPELRLAAGPAPREMPASFSAHGRVAVPPGVDPSRCGVSLRTKAREPAATLARAAVHEDGSWSLDGLLVRDERSYILRADGPALVPDEVWLGMPDAGARVRVDFDLRAGHRVAVRVLGEAEQPISGAEVELWWESGGSADEKRQGETWRAVLARTAEDGRAEVHGAPSGEAGIRVRAQGYSYVDTFGPLLVPDDVAEELLLRLQPGGILCGRCTHFGQPLADFWVTCEAGSDSFQLEFQDAENGFFRIEHAPLGRCFVYATTPELPKCETVATTIEAGEEAFVELDLPVPAYARGRVVAEGTREPVSGARIDVHLYSGGAWSRLWGPGGSTDAGGEFAGVPVAPAMTGLLVSAEGFASRSLLMQPDEEGGLDCGLILLPRSQPLELRLLANEPVPFEEFRVDLAGTRVAFDREGIARYPAIGPGTAMVRVEDPGGRTIFFGAELRAGKEWIVEIEVRGDRELEVFVEHGDTPLPERCGVVAMSRRVGGDYFVQTMPLGIDGSARFEAVAGDQVSINVVKDYPDANDAIGSRIVALEPGITKVTVQVDAHRPRVRLSMRGTPMVGAHVWVFLEPPFHAWYDGNRTGQDGGFWATFPEPEGRYHFNAYHDTLGEAWNVPLDLGGLEDGFLEVELDANACLELRLVDGAFPLPATLARIEGRLAGGVIAERGTDEAGEVEWRRLDPRSRVDVVVSGPELWPTRVAVQPGPAVQEIQVRRRGELVLALTRSGSPVPACRVDLVSQEFGERVEEWIAQGLVQGSLTTDSTGTAHVRGLPNGAYRWTVHAAGDSPQSGSLGVPPRGTARVTVELD